MAEDTRAHHAQIPGALRWSSKESPGQRGSLPVQEHMSAGAWKDQIPKTKNFNLVKHTTSYAEPHSMQPGLS